MTAYVTNSLSKQKHREIHQLINHSPILKTIVNGIKHLTHNHSSHQPAKMHASKNIVHRNIHSHLKTTKERVAEKLGISENIQPTVSEIHHPENSDEFYHSIHWEIACLK